MSSVVSKDRGAKALLKKVAEMKGNTLGLRVGVFSDEQAEGATAGTTVSDLALWHEYGTKTKDGVEGVPARSFIRAWYDEALEKNKATFRSQFVQVVQGKITHHQMWERLGLKFVADIRQRIRGHIAPPLKQKTIDRKGSSTPLIDTGQLVASITHVIE